MKRFFNMTITLLMLAILAVFAVGCQANVDKITLDKTTLNVNVGANATLTATLLPESANSAKVTWTSSDEKTATVENGKVTGVKAGKATITATAGKKTATCVVTVVAFDKWDGSVATNEEMTSIYDNASQTYTITKAKQLAWISQYVNNVSNTNNTLDGITIKLQSHLDLDNKPWTPIGNSVESYPSITFNGTFDGQYYTIYNLTCAQKGEYSTAGLFGTINKGLVKNLTIDGATITSDHYAGGIVAYSSNSAGVTVQKCTVKGATIVSSPALVNETDYDNGDKVGGIAGYVSNGEITGCVVDNCKITAYRHIGGLIGYFGSGNFSNNTVKNTTITQDFTNGYKDFSSVENLIGKFVGNGATIGENNDQNVALNQVNKPQ